jgi:hypothetical protein
MHSVRIVLILEFLHSILEKIELDKLSKIGKENHIIVEDDLRQEEVLDRKQDHYKHVESEEVENHTYLSVSDPVCFDG